MRGPLSRRERELIATVVSVANDCDYCKHHHSDALDRVTRDRSLAREVRADFQRANLTEKESAMLRYADLLRYAQMSAAGQLLPTRIANLSSTDSLCNTEDHPCSCKK
jgi:uncharacterized peroxidase-related enzyme